MKMQICNLYVSSSPNQNNPIKILFPKKYDQGDRGRKSWLSETIYKWAGAWWLVDEVFADGFEVRRSSSAPLAPLCWMLTQFSALMLSIMSIVGLNCRPFKHAARGSLGPASNNTGLALVHVLCVKGALAVNIWISWDPLDANGVSSSLLPMCQPICS